MPPQDQSRRETLGPRRDYVVLRHHVDEGVPHHERHACDGAESQRGRGKNEMIEGTQQVRGIRPTEDRNREVVLLTRGKDGPPVEPELRPRERELHDESEPEEMAAV